MEKKNKRKKADDEDEDDVYFLFFYYVFFPTVKSEGLDLHWKVTYCEGIFMYSIYVSG